MDIQILIFDGFDELDVIGVYEPLRMAQFNVKLMSLSQQETIESIHGIKIKAHGVINIKNTPDLLIVPGGGWVAHAERGAWVEAKKGEILEIIKDFHQAEVVLASVCTGSMLLAKAGLLKGRPATTNHQALKELADTGAKVVSKRVVDDGDIITASGVTSSLDLGLWLIERFAGAEKSAQIAEQLEFERRVEVH